MRLTLLAPAVLFSMVSAAVFYVHPESTQNCIQDCLDACAAGDTVLVGPGSYLENIIWPDVNGIDLLSEHGPDTTIIDGDSAGSVIACTTGVDATTAISGFTISNGRAEAGGGIRCYRSSPRIVDCIIRDNAAYGDPGLGGGIACLDSSAPVVYGNTISDNGAGGELLGSGGGIYCGGHSAARIACNSIVSNACGIGAGGGIWCVSSDCVIDSNVIQENRVLGSGAGICITDCAPTVACNLITLNVAYGLGATVAGGGILCDRSAAFISKNTITLNTVFDGLGGGIHCADASPTIDSCVIMDNGADGVHCTDGSAPEIHFSDITANAGCAVTNADSTLVVNAQYNWWGDPTGPYHPDSNPSGQGDTVSDHVDFGDWLLLPMAGLEEQPLPSAGRLSSAATVARGVLWYQPTAASRRPPTAILIDVAGRVVMGLVPGGNDVSALPPGIYILREEGAKAQGSKGPSVCKIVLTD